MTTEFEAPDTELEQRLRRDAATWGGAPSAATSSPWRSAPARRRGLRRVLLSAAAAVLVTGLLTWWLARGDGPERTELAPRDLARCYDTLSETWSSTWSTTVGPLEREYAALRQDVGTVADVMWRGVPRPVRSLFGG